jgi:hypothetical protein
MRDLRNTKSISGISPAGEFTGSYAASRQRTSGLETAIPPARRLAVGGRFNSVWSLSCQGDDVLAAPEDGFSMGSGRCSGCWEDRPDSGFRLASPAPAGLARGSCASSMAAGRQGRWGRDLMVIISVCPLHCRHG